MVEPEAPVATAGPGGTAQAVGYVSAAATEELEATVAEVEGAAPARAARAALVSAASLFPVAA